MSRASGITLVKDLIIELGTVGAIMVKQTLKEKEKYETKTRSKRNTLIRKILIN